MPCYVNKQLIEYNHPKPKKPVNTPWERQQIKHIQQIVGSIPYYSRATDPAISHALSEFATQQSHTTENTLKRCNHFLDYMATHPDARICYYASDMVLNVHSDASYLCEGGQKKSSRNFLPWLHPQKQSTHKTQRCDRRTLHNIKIPRRTRRPLP
eukprot:CCRYP_001437-RA/>CCRYP_001437-RA protein AED:0.37 eAED:0.37 QI:0/0/0/1/0/0/2/0/154